MTKYFFDSELEIFPVIIIWLIVYQCQKWLLVRLNWRIVNLVFYSFIVTSSFFLLQWSTLRMLPLEQVCWPFHHSGISIRFVLIIMFLCNVVDSCLFFLHFSFWPWYCLCYFVLWSFNFSYGIFRLVSTMLAK